MLRTLEKGDTALTEGAASLQMVNQKKTVVAAFVTDARMERDCIRLYAQTHPEVRAAAVLSGGGELLDQLRSGLVPQVLVLDTMLADMGILSLLEAIHTLHLDPEPVILLTVPIPEQTAARRAMQVFGDCQVILKPYRLKELFDQIYLLGAGIDQYRLYRARGFCRRCLQQMKADLSMSGCEYLEQMILYAYTAERPFTMAALYQMTALESDTQEASVAAAVMRLSRKMWQQATPLYQDLCRRCGLEENAVLPNGKLVKGLLELLRQEMR